MRDKLVLLQEFRKFTKNKTSSPFSEKMWYTKRCAYTGIGKR